MCWGIELLQDSNNAAEYVDCFKEEGAYWPMKNIIKAYALVECRRGVSKVLEENCWYLVYDDNFEKITIYQKRPRSYCCNDKINGCEVFY
jgi:hypothetical protein